MKAIVIHRFGPPEVLSFEDVPDPAPRAGEIRIRVHGATVNRVLDVSLRAEAVNDDRLHEPGLAPQLSFGLSSPSSAKRA